MQIISEALKTDADAREALQFLLAQHYIEMGQVVGSSNSSKVMFMDPRSIPATIEGMQAIVGNLDKDNPPPPPPQSSRQSY
jgi:hypothetical protein